MSPLIRALSRVRKPHRKGQTQTRSAVGFGFTYGTSLRNDCRLVVLLQWYGFSGCSLSQVVFVLPNFVVSE